MRAVASETYPSNTVCAHPECKEKVTLRPDGTPTIHHCFPRSQINGSSYFVAIRDEKKETVVPHAVGLCGSGTTGHHGDVEEHRAWIKLEDGEWNWYERRGEPHPETGNYPDDPFVLVGPLNPQPGSREARAKRRTFKGEARRKRINWQMRVPSDEQEDGAGGCDDDIELLREKPEIKELYPDPDTPPYYIARAGWRLAIDS